MQIIQFHLNILRTVLKIPDYHVSCISIGYLNFYVVITVKTIIDNETKVFFSLD